MAKEIDYDIVSINWNPEQTKIWKHYVKKYCPRANIVLVNDHKPFSKIVCGAKPWALQQEFKTNRLVYLDTDTIVTRDLLYLFDDMGDKKMGVTLGFNPDAFMNVDKKSKDKDWAKKAFRPREKLVHYFNGMMLFKGELERASYMARLWAGALALFQKHGRFLEEIINDEIAMAYVIHKVFPKEDIWEIPLPVHCNIAKAPKATKTYPHNRGGYGSSVEIPPVPPVLHYHSRPFLEPFGLAGLLDVEVVDEL